MKLATARPATDGTGLSADVTAQRGNTSTTCSL